MRGEGFPLQQRSRSSVPFGAALLLALFSGCAKDQGIDGCAVELDSLQGPLSGYGRVFSPDPKTTAQLSSLSPTSDVDGFAVLTELSGFLGRGVLAGQQVDVRSGRCEDSYGASTEDGQFLYRHSDPHFQEVMAYAHGDRFRSALKSADSLLPSAPLEVIAHCGDMDNAYFYRSLTQDGLQKQVVCLGDSVASPGASFADDGMVIVHEIQHAMTVNAYDPWMNMNRFFYDEAGTLNEGLSDFLSLLHFKPTIPLGVDEKIFSPWALGSFFGGMDLSRSVHRCPAYSADFSSGCGLYSETEDLPWPGFSAKENRVSFTYPDGLGWPTVGRGTLREIHADYSQREEIHANSVVISGALWDAYEAAKAAGGREHALLEKAFISVIRSALMALPKPSIARQSPVSLPGFARTFLERAETLDAFDVNERQAMRRALALRGLVDVSPLAAGWAGVGAGGIRVVDHPSVLRSWLIAVGGNPRWVNPLSQNVDGKLQPGELAAVWFDVANLAERTAGGVTITATSSDPSIRFLDGSANVAPISSQSAQIMIAKINGSRIVSALKDDADRSVATSNTAFGSNPSFDEAPTTALWIQVDRSVERGRRALIQIEARPSNGEASVIPFEVVIQ